MECKKCGNNNISWTLCNDCGHEHLPYPKHKQGEALDIEIEQQDVAQSEYWIHNDIRDDIYLVTFNNCGEIKSINIVAKSESEAMDLALELSNSSSIYSAIKL
jgi:hypothetical protein